MSAKDDALAAQVAIDAITTVRKQAQDSWFPLVYPKAYEARLKVRQEACKNFIFGPIRTSDAQEYERSPIKSIPRLPYLERMIEILLAEQDPTFPKVRRMIISLTCEAYAGVWRLCERPACHAASIHGNLDAGETHIEENIKGVMWENLPKWFTGQWTTADSKGELRLLKKFVDGKWIPWDSWIRAYPTGSRAARGEGHQVVLWDEFSTHPGAKAANKALQFTTFGRTLRRGQVIKIGTVNPDTVSGRYFKELYDAEAFARARMIARYGFTNEQIEDVAAGA